MQGEQIHLLWRLDRYERHGGPLHRLCNRFCVAIVILMPLQKRLHVLGWHQAYIMAERLKLAANMVGPGTGLHANQAGRDVGQALSELHAGELEAQHDGAALILAD
jgi:hypothetical protein